MGVANWSFFVHAPARTPSSGRIVSPMNARWQWGARARWANQWREAVQNAVWVSWSQARRPPEFEPKAMAGEAVTVRLEVRRHGRPLDGDNLTAAMKPVRDEIAKILGIDDAESEGHRWIVTESRAKPVGVHVTIEAGRPQTAIDSRHQDPALGPEEDVPPPIATEVPGRPQRPHESHWAFPASGTEEEVPPPVVT
jgi:hypothetical protein